MLMRQMLVLVGVGCACWVLAGCAQAPRPLPEPQEPVAVPELPPVQANGAIFQAQRGMFPLFEDRRPRQVGDIITIELDEQVSASRSSSSSVNRSAGSSLTFDQLPDVIDALADWGFDVSGEVDFSGGGDSQANNTFTGTITVTVQEVLPNGNLQVTGEKQVAINRGTEYIRFYGVVNPRTISGRNTVASSHVADARIQYIGDGYVSEAQRMGWLQRFFLNTSPY